MLVHINRDEFKCLAKQAALAVPKKSTIKELSGMPNYGCEGIYIDCCLRGKFDESGCSILHVGTLKTLKRDLDAAKIMGELCGVLMHHATTYVNANLDRYKTDRQPHLFPG